LAEPAEADTVDALRLASSVVLPTGPWATVLDCLCGRFPAVPREQWTSRMTRGLVRDGAGQALDPASPFRAGLRVRYFREVAAEAPVPFTESILHADAHLVVADKPHFLPVAPVGGWVAETLLTRLIRRLGNPSLVPLHRIDRGTAGLVLLSANPATRARYQALFRERRIEKIYEALAPPLPATAFPLLRRSRVVRGDPFFRMREEPGPPNSETRIAVIGQVAALWRYELVPVTGRKHQLRVHMAAIGAPVANDPYYPALAARASDDYARPLALLARSLAFVDPLTGEPRRFVTRRSLLIPPTPPP
jgi:tRNA pseudouridine32 synthase/23S rRNA pseudouridine746 synthase